MPASMAMAAAVAADWPRIMNTGSMRMEPKAMCELETQTGTITNDTTIFVQQVLDPIA